MQTAAPFALTSSFVKFLVILFLENKMFNTGNLIVMDKIIKICCYEIIWKSKEIQMVLKIHEIFYLRIDKVNIGEVG